MSSMRTATSRSHLLRHLKRVTPEYEARSIQLAYTLGIYLTRPKRRRLVEWHEPAFHRNREWKHVAGHLGLSIDAEDSAGQRDLAAGQRLRDGVQSRPCGLYDGEQHEPANDYGPVLDLGSLERPQLVDFLPSRLFHRDRSCAGIV